MATQQELLECIKRCEEKAVQWWPAHDLRMLLEAAKNSIKNDTVTFTSSGTWHKPCNCLTCLDFGYIAKRCGFLWLKTKKIQCPDCDGVMKHKVIEITCYGGGGSGGTSGSGGGNEKQV